MEFDVTMPTNINDLFTLQQGSSVYHEDSHYVVLTIVDLEKILAQDVNTQEIKKLRIAELTYSPRGKEVSKSSQIAAIPDEDWQIAQQRLEIIQPLLHKLGRTKADVEERAEKYNIHINTIYKWLKIYEGSGLLTSLMPKTRKDAGTTKLNEKTETIIKTCIEDSYLTKQKKSIPALFREIEKECKNANLPVPHCNTIRNRINTLSDELKIRRRFGRKKADEIYRVNDGEFPGADYPLAVVQIDHTKLDIILVDDEHRQPLDRPWITLAMDVFSRMVLGFYVSFDAPGAIGTGMCLAHAITPKDEWLANHDISASWPCWGIPRTVHADNAKEFRGSMLTKACQEYGFSIEWRPVGRPNFGGHIERLLGSFANQIHDLPGTTFSNTSQREGYDSSKNSALTLKEFERWFAHLVTEVYHQKLHTGIGCSPIQKYEEGIFGTKQSKGIGLPPRIKDTETLRINFLPYVERTIQDYGVVIDEIYYFHDVLRPWVNCLVEGRSKLKRKFIFRRDPRDISTVWFFDPELKTYYPIPYRNTSLPAITIWELKEVRRRLKEDGVKNINEELIFSAYEKMLEIEQQAVTTTKKTRRAAQKRKSAQDKSILNNSTSLTTANNNNNPAFEDDDIEITPFDEMLEVNKR